MITKFKSARYIKILSVLIVGLSLVGCASNKIDYTAFKQSKPKSILVLPPINKSHEVKATNVVFANSLRPLAQSGYYVFPASLVNETFKNNGMQVNDEIHEIPYKKLYDIFGADAALYITITDYGTRFRVIQSVAIVTAKAKLIDLRTGELLWKGKATANSEEGQDGQNQASLTGLLVNAVAKQIVGTLVDESATVSKITAHRLLSAESPKSVLYGPYHPKYEKQFKK